MTVPRISSAGRFDPASLFHPASIAVLGADTEAGAQILANVTAGDFKGQIHAPEGAAELPPGVALALLAIVPEQIGPAMTELAQRNCFTAMVPGAAEDLAGHAVRTGVRVLGPHSFGLAIPALGLNATRSHLLPPRGRLALVSQSTALCRAVIDWAGPNGLGFSHIVGLGGNADIGFGVVLDWLSRDAGTGAILLDIARIKNHRLFLSAARAAARLRPVVAIRPGLRLLDDDGAAARSFEAALRRAGVLCVSRFEDLLAAAETLTRARPLRHETLAIVSNSIGPARLAADEVLRDGLGLLQDDGLDRGIQHVPSADLAAAAFRLAAKPDLGAVLVVHAPQGRSDDTTIASLTVPCPNQRAALLVCAMGETTGAPHRTTLGSAGLPVFDTPSQAVGGFRHLVSDRRNREAARELPASTVLTLAPDRSWVRDGFRRARAAGRLALSQDETLDVLAAYGIPTVPTRFAADAADAATAAAMLGYPVVVKLRELTPPADRAPGGVAFDLRDTRSVTATGHVLLARAARRDAEAALLVQRQVGRGREISVKVADDATFGPIIVFGAGGTAPSPLDKAADLPPLNLALAHALIRRSPAGARLARPLRDRPAADTDAVAETLVRISQLVVDFPEIAVLDVPSLFVDQSGVLVADAWLLLRGENDPPGRLSIAPYPSELVEHVQLQRRAHHHPPDPPRGRAGPRRLLFPPVAGGHPLSFLLRHPGTVGRADRPAHAG